MKGKNHLITGIIFLTILFIIDLFLGLVFYDKIINMHPALSIIAIYSFFAGVLLPDADKTNTWIFKFFFPYAIFAMFTSFIISTMHGKKFRHRGITHTAQGIIITTTTSTIISLLMLSIFINPTLISAIIFFLAIITGQILHLIFDF
ncbi:MAG: metal-dependent hydrolase [Candidatus Woesearchaeota archaeon]